MTDDIINIFSVIAVTAANATEPSYPTLCTNDDEALPCLADEFSLNWMLDSALQDSANETLLTQYELVKDKTVRSHVSKYGDERLEQLLMADFQGIPLPECHFRSERCELCYISLIGIRNYQTVSERWNPRDVPILIV